LYCVDTGDQEGTDAIFNHLHSQREALEAAYGGRLDWEDLPNARACRIADYRSDSDVTRVDQHDIYLTWFFDVGTRLRKALAAVQAEDEI
jgi:hypothetical protein